MKLLFLLISLGATGYLMYWALTAQRPVSPEDKEASAPKRQLDNVRAKAKQFEQGDQHRVDEAERKTAE